MRSALPVLLIAAAIIGCNSNKSQAPVVAAPIQGQTAAPGAAPAAAPSAGLSVTGKLLERIAASPYSYLRIQTAQGEVWAAVPETKVEKGAEVTVTGAMIMRDFESKTLKRTFAQIYFGTLAGSGPAAAPAGDPHASAGQAAAVEVGKVEKASGADARTVAEVWAQKGALKGKTVTVRGKVVKYNAGIMGKNWLHLQDGSGDAKAGSNDITVTSNDPAAKGDTVTVTGVVRTDKDFGSGYSYPVLIEDAKVKK
ncbi:MAG TPA: hypothetical protein VJ528_08010 [Geothrix sp.]|uniref:hypothetical protein n=1 Tax=Geothrix mesophila TaxID=2922723 RepID=UPI001FAC6100|nr:hypothetical protein [Geothrix sp. SG198]HJV38768.1 hypothetical protein [Geothrix sp.]